MQRRFLRSMISKWYRNEFERCAPSGPQKHITNKSDWFYNHFNLYTVVWTDISESNLNLNILWIYRNYKLQREETSPITFPVYVLTWFCLHGSLIIASRLSFLFSPRTLIFYATSKKSAPSSFFFFKFYLLNKSTLQYLQLCT